jgi:hypothetical protein
MKTTLLRAERAAATVQYGYQHAGDIHGSRWFARLAVRLMRFALSDDLPSPTVCLLLRKPPANLAESSNF